MIYKQLFDLSSVFPPFNLFQYITFRSFLSFFTSFFVCWILGRFFIERAQKNGFRERVSSDGPSSHQSKAGVPTMGGSFILAGVAAVCLLWVNISHPLIIGTLCAVYGFALVGLWDDWLKIKKRAGLSARRRLAAEFLICFAVLSCLIFFGHLSTVLYIPIFKNVSFDLGWAYVLFASFVITGSANGVNLTDGLDGLAVFPAIVCASALAVFSYAAGHSEIAAYLGIPFIPGAGELAPLAAAAAAGGLGFLWYNSHPAQVFMGDVGSLGLGAFLGAAAVLTKNEILLVLLGGLFVAETASVMVQVLSFKLTGKRVFKMAPIHHHFELKGLSEQKITVRFWIVSILLAVLSLSLLKIR